MLTDFARVANAIAATTRKNEKEKLLAAYLVTLDDASLERAAVFFAGSPFPRREQRVTGVGWATIGDAVIEATDGSGDELWTIYPKYADLGDAVAEFYGERDGGDVTLSEVGEVFDRIAGTSGANEKKAVLV